MRETFWFIGMMIAVLAFVIGVIFGIDAIISSSEEKSCKQKAEIYGYPTKYYGNDTGCIMEIDGKKIRIAT